MQYVSWDSHRSALAKLPQGIFIDSYPCCVGQRPPGTREDALPVL